MIDTGLVLNDTVVLTGYDETFDQLGRLTAPIMERYAVANHYDFRLRRERPAHVPPLWWKLNLVRDALADYKKVLWLDADMVVTNNLSIDHLPYGINISKDWGADATELGHFSAGAYLISEGCATAIDWCLHGWREYMHSPFGDQDALRACFNEPDYRPYFNILPRRTFNAVHPKVDPTVVEPWQPGDFLCHLTMVPLKRRIELFHELTQTSDS